MIFASLALALATAKTQSICPAYVTIKAVITEYTATESPGVNARGHLPTVGRSVACPRALGLGIEVSIGSHRYACDDRTNRKYDGRFDIFAGSYFGAMDFGKQSLPVTIFFYGPRHPE